MFSVSAVIMIAGTRGSYALTLNMPMGSRATRFPRVKARVPGSAKRRRYGVNGDMGEPSPDAPGEVQHLLRRH